MARELPGSSSNLYSVSGSSTHSLVLELLADMEAMFRDEFGLCHRESETRPKEPKPARRAASHRERPEFAIQKHIAGLPRDGVLIVFDSKYCIESFNCNYNYRIRNPGEMHKYRS